jgi:hypothetical protein
MKQATIRFAAITLAIIAFAAPGLAQSQTMRVRGQISQVEGDRIHVKTVDGKRLTIALAPDASVTSVVPAKLSEIKPGRFVGTAARPEPGHPDRWRAIEFHIFPVGSRLSEGHRPWEPEAGATMTNADVTAAVAKSRHGVLTLTTNGQNFNIDVPPGTPIVAMRPGTRNLVKKGARISINQVATAGDGTMSAKAITVTTVRNWPPK